MNDIVKLQREGARLMAEGATIQAIKFFEEAHKLQPSNPGLIFNLAACEHNIGQHASASRNFKKTLICDPTFGRALGQVVTFTAKNSDPARALLQVRWLACLVPLSAQARALNTLYLFELKRHEAVAPAARRSLVCEPSAAGTYRLMGLSASVLQQLDTSSTALERACILQPSWANAHLALAGVKFAQRDFQRALAEATTAVALGAYPAEGAFWQARAALALNRVGDADEYFAKAVSLEPQRQVSARIARLTLNMWDFQELHELRNQENS